MRDEKSISALLKRTARDLVAEFSELRLIHDWPALTDLGSGTLWIDLATGQTRYNGRLVDPLHIAGYLRSWLRESLAGAGLSKTSTQDAALTAALTMQHYSGQRRRDSRWIGNPTRFIGCRAELRCRLVLEGVVVEASGTEEMEWPEPRAAKWP
jgi:hypothetical protein